MKKLESRKGVIMTETKIIRDGKRTPTPPPLVKNESVVVNESARVKESVTKDPVAEKAVKKTKNPKNIDS